MIQVRYMQGLTGPLGIEGSGPRQGPDAVGRGPGPCSCAVHWKSQEMEGAAPCSPSAGRGRGAGSMTREFET